ncbi:hypothetical protein OESDEN_08796 [Oesophagostomum dentatum]|uniref:Uncharacterized protein n=1 Tax=Oesophagostomum dentatum TaxID=61180 RepID=A0A0B1T268_OESDE|nr:hypothetical protein OESDEN_08796 [Oesophagostomum dentatum]
MCRVNSRHFVPDVELEFHERQCEGPLYRQIVAELKIEPMPVKSLFIILSEWKKTKQAPVILVPSSDSSDNDEGDDGDSTSVSSGDTDYSTSKDDLLRRILEGPGDE